MREILHPKCTCECHKDGNQIMHCMACCSECYEKFIDKNGKVDLIRYNDILRELHERHAPYIDGCEYVVKNKYNHDSTKVKEKRRNLP